jgi:hypothetical protein
LLQQINCVSPSQKDFHEQATDKLLKKFFVVVEPDNGPYLHFNAHILLNPMESNSQHILELKEHSLILLFITTLTFFDATETGVEGIDSS